MPKNIPKVGEYFYIPRGSSFSIYHQDSETTASPTGERIFNREFARKRVYKLNGWNYKPKAK